MRQRRTATAVVVLSVLASIPVGFAVFHHGFPVTQLELTAEEVWVTNGEELLSGRLNRQIEELTAAVGTSTASADVFQNGDDAFVYEPELGTVQRIDPAHASLIQGVDVPAGSELAYGGNRLAVLSPNGELWVLDVGGELSFDLEQTPPRIALKSGARVAVSEDGVVFAADREALYTLAPDAAEPARTTLDGLGADFQMAAVGDQAVIFDVEANAIRVGAGNARELPVPAARIQQSGATNEVVVVATESSLLLVPLAGGEITVIDADVSGGSGGGAAAPVSLNGCVHGAWAESQRYLAACAGTDVVRQDIEQPTAGARLEFRVNRDVIALNNLTNGNVWLLDATMRLVDNWEEVTPPDELETEEGDEKSSTQSFEDTLAERTEQNRVPLARDDNFGVRPSKTTVLAVLENDTDPDGDVLTVVNHSEVSEAMGRLEYIDGGRALQFTPAENAAGTVSFRYTVSDGAGGVAEASVNLTVRPFTQNEPPVVNREGAASVEQGQSIGYNLLTDWIDPDGDDLFLVSAAPASADSVSFSPDGFITYEHRSSELGAKAIEYVVSDGAVTASGTLTVTVEASGSMKPIGTPDHATAFTGETVLVRPLDNDLSPSGAALTLLGVAELPDGLSVTENTELGTLSLSASEPGSYNVIYSLAAGALTSVGLVRLDVSAVPDTAAPPIAVKDTAYLRPGEPFLVPALRNDVSPNGAVLAIQSIEVDETLAGVSIEVLDNSALRITAAEALTEQLQLRYTVSDGSLSSSAGVTIVPVPPLIKHQPPIAVNDQATVRAGDVVTVPVLLNDHHPDSATMTLVPELSDVATIGDDALAFITADTVRFQAPKEEGVFTVAYTITDAFAETSTAAVTFTVVAVDEESNRAPIPVPLTARTYAGQTVKVEIPLDGIDPDGDSALLDTLSIPPSAGRIVETGNNYFIYESYPSSAGTDQFSYTVADAFGATATGVVRIGVVPRPEANLPPVAVDDSIEVAPGRTATVPVLLNDSDPNGLALNLDEKLLEVDAVLEAEVVDDRIVVTVPEEEGGYAIRYQMDNGAGGIDTAFLQVSVTADAKPQYPSASDQFVTVEQLRAGGAVEVDVLGNAQNPSGRVSDLVLSLVGPNAGAGEAQTAGSVTVTPNKQRQTIAYRLTNEVDQLSATAFIVVPPIPGSSADDEDDEPLPYLSAGEQQIDMNRTTSWESSALVTVPSGRDLTVIGASATSGTATWTAGGITFVPTKDYRGPASVALTVTDSAKDPARTVLLTLPINVGDPGFADLPPSFTPRSEKVEAGEAGLTIDLRASTSHPNPEVLAGLGYGSLSGQTSGINASLSGSVLTVTSPLGTKPGETTRLAFEIRHRDLVVPGYVDITVVSSSRPKPQAIDDQVPDARPGSSVSIDALANDYNPFGPDSPLTIVGAELEQASVNGASVSFTSGQVRVTTAAGWTGTLSVVYRVQDATKDQTREAQGRILVIVKDVPDAPRQPVAAAGNGQVTVTFQAPASNNSPITGYIVRHTDGTRTDCAAGISCVIAATNGVAFTATVAAVNGVGEGPPSPQSAAVTPYGIPDAPRNPQASASGVGPNGVLTFSWQVPGNTGGGPVSYQWKIDGEANWRATESTSVSIGGQAEGVHSFVVRAVNKGGGAVSGEVGASASVAAPWRPGTLAVTITMTTCPEPASTYNNPPTNNDVGCTMNSRGYLQAGTIIDGRCRSQRNGTGWFYIAMEGGYYDGWFVREEHTNYSASAVPNC